MFALLASVPQVSESDLCPLQQLLFRRDRLSRCPSQAESEQLTHRAGLQPGLGGDAQGPAVALEPYRAALHLLAPETRAAAPEGL